MYKLSVNQSRLIIGIFAALSVAYGLYIKHDRKKSLKISETVIARVTGKWGTRQGIFVYVTYRYAGNDFENALSTGQDTLNNGDSVLIEVSKSKPDKYIKLIGRK